MSSSRATPIEPTADRSFCSSDSSTPVGAGALQAALDYVSDGVFASCSHPGPSGTSQTLPDFPERASELILYLVAGARTVRWLQRCGWDSDGGQAT